jgi:threonyl-tRNA synthetase
MNCPGGILVYKNSLHSYKDLPIRLAELGLVHRHEASGALNGLFRVRAFTQDDAHIFCTPEQLVDEITTLLEFYQEMYEVFGLDYRIELSTRPEVGYIGDIEIWNKSEAILEEACRKSGKEFKINPGDGAFYGPKLDFKLRDSMGRIWQCGTIQLDMNLPERFDCSYVDSDGNKKRPIMLHRACLGSIERFIGILIEHYAGAFPTWMAPVQVNLLPVNNDYHLEYTNKLLSLLKEEEIRVEKDDANEKLGYRLRNSVMRKIPYTVVIGDNEVNNNLVTYRKYGSQEQITVSYDEFLSLLKTNIKNKGR